MTDIAKAEAHRRLAALREHVANARTSMDISLVLVALAEGVQGGYFASAWSTLTPTRIEANITLACWPFHERIDRQIVAGRRA